MQSVLFKNRNISILRRYLQTKPIAPTKFKQFSSSSILKPLATGSSHLNDHFPFVAKSILYFKSSSPRSFEDPFSNKKASDDGKQSSSNGDDEEKKRELFQKRIAMFTFAIVLFYLNLSYLQKLADMQKSIDAKDRELEEEKKRKLTQVVAHQDQNQGINYNINSQPIVNNTPVSQAPSSTPSTPKVKSTLIAWSEFVSEHLSKGNVIELIANRKTDLVLIRLKNPVEFSGRKLEYLYMKIPPETLESKLDQAQDALNLENRVFIQYKDTEMANSLINMVIIGGLFFMFFRFGKAALSKIQNMQTEMYSKFTDKKFQVVDPHLKSGSSKITFKDVAGLYEAKVEIKEFVDYLRDPTRFKKLGAKVPKGALLTGPPGCGKTLLAKAVASEANVPFFNVAGTEFIEMIGGVGASRVRSLFEEARKQSPAIIFIDEIDAIGRKRSEANSASSGGGSNEFDQTLNQLLVSMDGLESNSQIVVLASTNRADILDKALLRPGRLDRLIDIDLPTYDERIDMLNVHIRNLKINFTGKDREDFLSQISHLTPGFSGADLANICNEAALMAAREGKKDIDKHNFYAALERVIAGAEKKNSIITVEDKKLIAYREAGKVIVSWFHDYSDLILKVSLLSRTKLNAYSQFLPSDKKLYSKDELFDQLCLQFGGRAAETLVFNKVTTSSEEDLKRVTKMAYNQVESLGMNDVVGNMSFATQAEQRRSGGQVGQKPYSKKLRNTIDFEVNKLLASAHQSTVDTLTNNMSSLHKLAGELVERETLTYEEIVDILGEPVNKERYKVARSHISSEI